MIERGFVNPEDVKFEQNQTELENYYSKVEEFFGEDIFLLDEEARKKLIKEKVVSLFVANGIRIDLMLLRQRIDNQKYLLEDELRNDPGNKGLEKHISELVQQSEQVKKIFEECEYA